MSNLILRKFALEHPYYSTLPLWMREKENGFLFMW